MRWTTALAHHVHDLSEDQLSSTKHGYLGSVRNRKIKTVQTGRYLPVNEAEAERRVAYTRNGKGSRVSPTPRSLRACLRSTVNGEKQTTVLHAIMDFILFTHDTKIFFSLKIPDIRLSESETELSRLISWFQANRLSIHSNSQEKRKV